MKKEKRAQLMASVSIIAVFVAASGGRAWVALLIACAVYLFAHSRPRSPISL